jgi:hypothetical protein
MDETSKKSRRISLEKVLDQAGEDLLEEGCGDGHGMVVVIDGGSIHAESLLCKLPDDAGPREAGEAGIWWTADRAEVHDWLGTYCSIDPPIVLPPPAAGWGWVAIFGANELGVCPVRLDPQDDGRPGRMAGLAVARGTAKSPTLFPRPANSFGGCFHV